MDDHDDIDILASSTPGEMLLPRSIGSKNQSAAWDHIDKLSDPNPLSQGKCQYCGALIKYSSGTNAMHTHLDKCKKKLDIMSKRQKLDSSSMTITPFSSSMIDQEACQIALVKFFVALELSFSNLVIPSCRAIKVWQKLQAQVDKLFEAKLEERPSIRTRRPCNHFNLLMLTHTATKKQLRTLPKEWVLEWPNLFARSNLQVISFMWYFQEAAKFFCILYVQGKLDIGWRLGQSMLSVLHLSVVSSELEHRFRRTQASSQLSSSSPSPPYLGFMYGVVGVVCPVEPGA
ncbi:hypothetical protein JHK86_019047 [Glycine max]|nr:hypothetical protein JHK86_019047 [Glycine max]